MFIIFRFIVKLLKFVYLAICLIISVWFALMLIFDVILFQSGYSMIWFSIAIVASVLLVLKRVYMPKIIKRLKKALPIISVLPQKLLF